METYQEQVLRFRVVRHTELPEEYKEEYRKDGIDPDDMWALVYSFFNLESAERKLLELQSEARKTETFKIVDNGEASWIDRILY